MLVNQADHWVKELRKISRPLPPFTFTAPPQDTQWITNSLIQFIKRSTACPGPSKKPCSSMCRIQPSTGTLGNTSYLTYGTTSFWHCQTCSTRLPAFKLHLLITFLLVPSLAPPLSIQVGDTYFYGKCDTHEIQGNLGNCLI